MFTQIKDKIVSAYNAVVSFIKGLFTKTEKKEESKKEETLDAQLRSAIIEACEKAASEERKLNDEELASIYAVAEKATTAEDSLNAIFDLVKHVAGCKHFLIEYVDFNKIPATKFESKEAFDDFMKVIRKLAVVALADLDSLDGDSQILEMYSTAKLGKTVTNRIEMLKAVNAVLSA